MTNTNQNSKQETAAVYRRLGVEPIVNCGSSRSVYGNSTMSDPVRDAMESASHHHVILEELAEAVGQRLAELTGAEWGVVTAGSATGLSLGAAACVAANDPLRMLRLPGLFNGERRVVLTRKGERFAYDQGVRLVGAEIVEVEDVAGLKAAFKAHNVVGILLLAERDADATMKFDQIQPEASAANVPIIVDAASEPLTFPEYWTSHGADLVVYSVSKLMRGPAASGLLLGRKPLVQAAWYNGPPHHSFGRVMKIGKEQIVGAIAAVERWFAHDHAAEQQRWWERLDTVRDRLQPINALKLEMYELAGGIPRLQVDWSECQPDLTYVELRAELLSRSPRILIDDFGGTDKSSMINPFALSDEHSVLVADALFEALTKSRPELSDNRSIEGDVSGEWVITIDFATGPERHVLALNRGGDELTGVHKTPYGEGEATGSMTATGFDLQVLHMVEGCFVGFRFVADDCTPDALSGFVELGAASSHARGPTTLGQFGRLPFSGKPA